VTVSNESLKIPPDHPLAIALYDLIGLQGVLMNQQNIEAALVNAGGDRASFDRHDAAMDLVSKEIEAVLKKYRLERGGDETCRVGLTYDARGYPIVRRPWLPRCVTQG
jgi:hypothetical protein